MFREKKESTDERKLFEILTNPIDWIDKANDHTIKSCLDAKILAFIANNPQSAALKYDELDLNGIMSFIPCRIYKIITKKTKKYVDLVSELPVPEVTSSDKNLRIQDATAKTEEWLKRIKLFYIKVIDRYRAASEKTANHKIIEVLTSLSNCLDLEYEEVTIPKEVEKVTCSVKNQPILSGSRAYSVKIYKRSENDIVVHLFFVKTHDVYKEVYMNMLICHYKYIKIARFIEKRIMEKKKALKLAKSNSDFSMVNSFIIDQSFIVDLIFEYILLKTQVEVNLYPSE